MQKPVPSATGQLFRGREVFEAGAEGYILKGDMDELPDSLRQMMQWQRYVGKTL